MEDKRCGPFSPCDGSPKNDASMRLPDVSCSVPFAAYDSVRRFRSTPPRLVSGNVGGAVSVVTLHDGSMAPKKKRRSLTTGRPASTPKSLIWVPAVLTEPLLA